MIKIAAMGSLIVVVLSIGAGCAGRAPRPMHTEDAAPAPGAIVADPAPGVAPPAAPPRPGLTGSAGPVALELTPQYGTLLAQMEAELNLLFTIEGADVPLADRQPLDLAIVIDRSGSMSGGKIAAVKVAALELLKRLTAADRVTLISYNHEITIHSTNTALDEDGRALLRREILAIHDGGTTALGPAMIEALQILEGARAGEARLSHAMLLSDGLANTGEKDPTVLGNRAAAAFGRGVSLSTLGVGLDYNEDLMTHLADQGGGQYHFIKDEQMIAAVLADEFKGLMATVARELRLEITPRAGYAVTEVFGYPVVREGERAAVRIGSLRAGQTRDIVLRLTGALDRPGEVEVGTFRLLLKDVTADGRAAEWNGVMVVKVSDDEVVVRDSEMTEVTVRLAEVESAREMEVAARAVEQGDYAGAALVLTSSIDVLRKQAAATPSADLDRQIVELEQAKGGIEQAKQSAEARKSYVKSKKSSAYQQGKKGKSRGVWKKRRDKSGKASSSEPWGSY